MSKILNKSLTIWITVNKKEQVKKNYTEIRDILNGVLLDYLDNQSVDAYRLEVLDKLKHSQNP